MGWAQKQAHRLIDWAAEGVWQWLICYFFFTPGAFAGSVVFLKHYGVPMIPAIGFAVVFALLLSLAILFFRNHEKMVATIAEIKATRGLSSSEKKKRQTRTSGSSICSELPSGKEKPGSISWPAGIGLLAILAISCALAIVYTKDSNDPDAIFEALPKVQKKILRTMWKYQKQTESLGPGDQKRFAMRIYTGTFEYLELFPSLDALTKRNWLLCGFLQAKNGTYCVINNGGMIFMRSLGSAFDVGETNVLPFDYVDGSIY
jgi:hypothetical protein